MKARPKKRARDAKPPVARLGQVDENGARHQASPTAVAAEALRTGIMPFVQAKRRGSPEIPHEDEKIQVGDPDDHGLANEYGGEETPGGSNPTPDQNSIDDIGRVYGLQEEDSGSLRSAAEVLSRRDRHRGELKAPRRSQP